MMKRQLSGLGPVLLFPLTTYSVLPSGLTLEEFGCHPVGIKPTTAESSPSNRTTATLFVPPLVTNAVFSSGESATLLGLLPFGNFPSSLNKFAGALVFTLPVTRLELVLIVTSASALPTATNSRLWEWFNTILPGFPFTGIRLDSVRIPPEI